MVKGVNKTVIEINDTGSNIFEKAVLFVTPKYSNLSAKRLRTEALRVINTFSPEGTLPTVRQTHKRKKRNLIIISSSFVVFAAAAVFILLRIF